MTDWANVRVFGVPTTTMSGIVRPSAYGIVADRRGRLAVVHTPIGLSLPGGGSDAGEAPEATVVRETREEGGLDIRVGLWRRNAIEHMFSTAELAQFEKRSTFCDATVLGSAETPSEPDHLLEWMPAADAAALLVPASHRWAVTEWRTSSASEVAE